MASTSELRESVIYAAKKAGRMVVAPPARDTTCTCPCCGLIESRPAAETIVLRCECGYVWDQDDGADKILLARLAIWRERPSDARILVPARIIGESNEITEKQPSRWARAKIKRREKETRMETARKVAASDAE